MSAKIAAQKSHADWTQVPLPSEKNHEIQPGVTVRIRNPNTNLTSTIRKQNSLFTCTQQHANAILQYSFRGAGATSPARLTSPHGSAGGWRGTGGGGGGGWRRGRPWSGEGEAGGRAAPNQSLALSEAYHH